MNCKSLSALGIALMTGLADAGTGREIKKGPIDHAVVYQEQFSKDAPIRIKRFPADSADLGTGADLDKPKYRQIAKDMQENAPALTLEALIADLKERGFPDVAELKDGEDAPAGARVIEGEFTKLNPGSQSKRYWVGFGAGKSQVCTKGRVVDAAGAVLLEYDHCRHEAIGFFGGDSAGQMAKDSARTGSHLGEFLELWAQGKLPK